MATPTTLPSSFSVGQTLTAAQMNSLRGAFRILQVNYGFTQVATSSASSTYVDTTLSATITPTSASSRIFCIISQCGYSTAASTGLNIRLVRDSTPLIAWTDLNFSLSVMQHSFTVQDSPNTTSAITYKTQMARNVGAGTVWTQVNNNLATMTLLEVSS